MLCCSAVVSGMMSAAHTRARARIPKWSDSFANTDARGSFILITHTRIILAPTQHAGRCAVTSLHACARRAHMRCADVSGDLGSAVLLVGAFTL